MANPGWFSGEPSSQMVSLSSSGMAENPDYLTDPIARESARLRHLYRESKATCRELRIATLDAVETSREGIEVLQDYLASVARAKRL